MFARLRRVAMQNKIREQRLQARRIKAVERAVVTTDLKIAQELNVECGHDFEGAECIIRANGKTCGTKKGSLTKCQRPFFTCKSSGFILNLWTHITACA